MFHASSFKNNFKVIKNGFKVILELFQGHVRVVSMSCKNAFKSDTVQNGADGQKIPIVNMITVSIVSMNYS